MKLFQKLSNKLFKQARVLPEDTYINPDENIKKSLCSIYISIDHNDEYSFEFRWDSEGGEKSSNGLSNLILGITYGLFSEDVMAILKEYKGESLDKQIVDNTIINTNKRREVLDDIFKSTKQNKTTQPFIKPSEVLKYEA